MATATTQPERQNGMSQRPNEKVKTMKKMILSIALMGLSTLAWADSKEAAADRLEHAGAVLHEVARASQPAAPQLAGARLRSSPSAVEAGVCRSVSKASTW